MGIQTMPVMDNRKRGRVTRVESRVNNVEFPFKMQSRILKCVCMKTSRAGIGLAFSEYVPSPPFQTGVPVTRPNRELETIGRGPTTSRVPPGSTVPSG